MANTNKYTKLVLDTLIFALGSFGAKLLSFIMMPFYTGVLSTNDYGTATMIADTASIILPIISVSMYHAVLRFGMDSDARREDAFSVALTVNTLGFGAFVLLYPFFKYILFTGRFSVLGDNILLLYAYVFASSLNSLFGAYTRARDKVRIFAIDGIVNMGCLVGFNILFLLGFHWGIKGYILSTILADCCSVIFLFWAAGLGKDISFGSMRKETCSLMVRYAMPMIPNSIFWWITNLSDRYMITAFISYSANGIYSAASKLPNLINTVAGIFTQAWQTTAIREYENRDRDFYKRVFAAYQALVFLTGGALLYLSRWVVSFWLDEAYYSAWEYIPFLILAIIFSCFSGFYSSIYMAMKKTGRSMQTTMLGAGVNVVLNLLLIPRMSIQGAALATFLSYLTVYIARVWEIHRLFPFENSIPTVIGNTVLLLAETAISLLWSEKLALGGAVVLLLLVAVNFREILVLLRWGVRFLKAKLKRK